MFRSIPSSLILACLVVPAMGGCVAFGLPSERYHDPADHGGLLGDWRPGAGSPPSHAEALLAEGAVLVDGHGHESCFPMDLDPMTGQPVVEAPPAPEVPWPKFHPVPTRPVFGTPSY